MVEERCGVEKDFERSGDVFEYVARVELLWSLVWIEEAHRNFNILSF